MKQSIQILALILFAGVFCLPARAQNQKVNQDGDLAFGGAGTAPGKFLELRDFTFDPAGNLYTLDGIKLQPKTKTRVGNLRVQKFTGAGKLVGTIDLRDEATGLSLGLKNEPQRLAVDSRGHVFVTQPLAGQVQEFAPEGKLVRTFDVPRAMAVTTWGKGDAERIAVVASRREPVKGKGQVWLEGDKIIILAPAGGIEKTIKLMIEKPLENVQDITTGPHNHFYVQAEPNAIYQFAPDGKLVRTLGGNPTRRNPDGSEVHHTVAVDSKGSVYTMTWGNPCLVTQFDADGKTVRQRGGQFQFADAWSGGNYTILAVDPQDRLWVGVTRVMDPMGKNFTKMHAVPCLVRAKADFFTNPPGAVRVASMPSLGYKADVTCRLPYNVSYEVGKEVPLEYRVAPANRHVDAVKVSWRVYDAFKTVVAKGEFPLALRNGQEAKADFSFIPGRFGAYFVHAEALSDQGTMGGVSANVGVTLRWANMPVLKEGESRGGWDDAPRQMWTGLPNMRVHPNGKLDQMDANLKQCEKYGVTVLVQLIDSLKKYEPQAARAMLERFKGRIKYLEVCNEPNFTGGADAYFKIHKEVFEMARQIDPNIQVMGPATVNMDLKYLRRLYELGFKDVCDIISIHDYEGNEGITPDHWNYKFAEMRKIMAEHGDADKPIWQTERAIAGVRLKKFQGLVQAIRTTLHRDLLETLKVPSEHNFHYYLNNNGYVSVPTYVWSRNGPQPAALALRTRHALTSALGRRYAGQLDFGPTGSAFYLAVRYAGTDGETVSLRNLGTRDSPLDFQVRGTQALDVVDSWGNTQEVPVRNGIARLTLEQMHVYVRLPKGALMIAPQFDFGRNLATQAKFAYSAPFTGELEWLNNGILESSHTGGAHTELNHMKVWAGDLPGDGPPAPQTLDITFDKPQKIDKVVLRGVRADNAMCALLRYDLQYQDGMEWKTIESIDRPMPRSEVVHNGDAGGAIWMDDTNFFVHTFAPITASRLRLVVRDTTRGLVPDDVFATKIARRVMLREVEIYGPAR